MWAADGKLGPYIDTCPLTWPPLEDSGSVASKYVTAISHAYDHLVSCSYQTTPSPALDALHHQCHSLPSSGCIASPALVMQCIQSWGGSGLVHETNDHQWEAFTFIHSYQC